MKIIVAKAIISSPSGDILLVRRSKTAPRRPLEWDFPGGFVDDEDESYQTATIREVTEETGLAIIDNHLHLAYTESELGHFDKGNDVSWLYYEGKVAITEIKLSYEHDDATWVSLDKAKELIKYDTQLRALDYIARRNVSI